MVQPGRSQSRSPQSSIPPAPPIPSRHPAPPPLPPKPPKLSATATPFLAASTATTTDIPTGVNRQLQRELQQFQQALLPQNEQQLTDAIYIGEKLIGELENQLCKLPVEEQNFNKRFQIKLRLQGALEKQLKNLKDIQVLLKDTPVEPLSPMSAAVIENTIKEIRFKIANLNHSNDALVYEKGYFEQYPTSSLRMTSQEYTPGASGASLVTIHSSEDDTPIDDDDIKCSLPSPPSSSSVSQQSVEGAAGKQGAVLQRNSEADKEEAIKEFQLLKALLPPNFKSDYLTYEVLSKFNFQQSLSTLAEIDRLMKLHSIVDEDFYTPLQGVEELIFKNENGVTVKIRAFIVKILVIKKRPLTGKESQKEKIYYILDRTSALNVAKAAGSAKLSTKYAEGEVQKYDELYSSELYSIKIAGVEYRLQESEQLKALKNYQKNNHRFLYLKMY